MLKRLKKSIPVLSVLAAVAITFVIIFIYTTSGIYYDYSHLIPAAGDVRTTEFKPVENPDGPAVEGMVAAIENEHLILYIDPDNAYIAVYDKRNGHIWHSNPLNISEDPVANDFEQEIMHSFLSLRFFNDNRNVNTFYTYRDSARLGQVELYSIPDGVRINMVLGSSDLGIRGIPVLISRERFEELLERVENPADVETVRGWYGRARGRDGFLRVSGLLGNNVAARREMSRIFTEEIGYTYEDLVADNNVVGTETDIVLNQFRFPIDFILDGESLVINFVMSEFESDRGNLAQGFELMRYFGAGGVDDEGYLFVPSGSGALIEFNNGKLTHERYTGVIYGVDPLGRRNMTQVINDINLPVFGIKNGDAAMLAIIENGAALATVNADISGRVSSYNSAWFNFIFRESDTATIQSMGQEANMLIIQEDSYEGDITVRYMFLAGEEAGYSGMAKGYREHLVSRGDLTPLKPAENTPFYLSMLGGVEKREFILGTPYFAIIPMSTYSQGSDIVTALNQNGVNSIQMQWLGWFNRGANHDAANKINPIKSVGSRKDMDDLTGLLQNGGGDLYPAVSFQALRRDSRRLSSSRDVAQELLGYSGLFTEFNRELLTVMRTMYHSAVYYIIHPSVMPFHVDDFIPAYKEYDRNALSLEDLGRLLSQSAYRRHFVDRESSKFIAGEQMGKLSGEFENIMLSGGNDYSFFAASHMIDLPLAADKYLLLDHSVPFIQMVLHGYVDHTGTAINTRDVYDFDSILLTSLATGSAPHFLWTYQPTTSLAFTQYEKFYSTHYETWFDDATEMYRIYNEIYKDLRTVPITNHQILDPGIPGSVGSGAVTKTSFFDTHIYVNTGPVEFSTGDITIPPMGYVVRIENE